MILRFLGTGTSYGVPFVACDCPVCTSDDPRDQRLRCSVLVESGDTRILIDTGPDLRRQLLTAGVSYISAVLWTHAHNDHIIGLDDLRPVSDRQGYIPGYANEDTLANLHRIFDYALATGREHGGFPRIEAHPIHAGQVLQLGDLTVTPLEVFHGQRSILSYKFEADGASLVYATDCSCIPEESRAAMRGCDVFVIDALRYRPHPTHFSVEQALAEIEEVHPGRAYFTHLAHDLGHAATESTLPPHIRVAYDGLEVQA
jgi:phosphoribosyl 1,2-cyclic phosphate phosphodiesterase